jgi:hypothetical protein
LPIASCVTCTAVIPWLISLSSFPPYNFYVAKPLGVLYRSSLKT